MTATVSLVALCLAAVVALPLAGALFGFGLAWGQDLYADRRKAAAPAAEPVPMAMEKLP